MTRLNAEDEAALEQLKCVLHRDWNPIGVVVPSDEYDSYALQLFGRLKRGASADEAAAYLSSVQVESIGVPETHEHNLAIAKKAQSIVGAGDGRSP
jgi:hypothetical protein